MIAIFTTNSFDYESVVQELNAKPLKVGYARLGRIHIDRMPWKFNKNEINIAFVENIDVVLQISKNTNKDYVFNPNPEAYGLDRTFYGVVTFLPDNCHIWK